MESPTLVIRWNESESPSYHWFIRGLRSDGSFYGEIRSRFDTPRASDGVSGEGRAIEGLLSPRDMERITQLAAQIRKQPAPETDQPVTGVLADGSVSNPTVLYRHPSSDANNAASEPFLEIIAILRPYIAQYYSSLN